MYVHPIVSLAPDISYSITSQNHLFSNHMSASDAGEQLTLEVVKVFYDSRLEHPHLIPHLSSSPPTLQLTSYLLRTSLLLQFDHQTFETAVLNSINDLRSRISSPTSLTSSLTPTASSSSNRNEVPQWSFSTNSISTGGSTTTATSSTNHSTTMS